MLIEVDIRIDPSIPNPDLVYTPGMNFNYDSYVDANGVRFLSYISYSKVRRYVAQQTLDGTTVYVSGGVAVPPPPPPTVGATVGQPNATTGVVTGNITESGFTGTGLTYSADTPTRGKITITPAGAFTYTPTATARHNAALTTAPVADKSDTVTVTVTDIRGGKAATTVTVAVAPANAAPTAKTTATTPNASTGVVTGTVTATDPDKDPLTYSANASKGTATITSAGAFTYTPTDSARHTASATNATAADKADTIKIAVNDGHGGVVAVPVSVTISPKNTAPTASGTIAKPDPVTGIAKGVITASDAEKDTLAYSASKPVNGTVAVNADGTFSYTPTTAARTAARSTPTTKTDSFTITLADGHGGTTAVALTATIAPSDSAPVAGTPSIGPANASTGVITGTVTATDPEKDALTYNASATAKGAVTITNTGAFTYTPTAAARHDAATGAVGLTTDTINVTVTDKYGATTRVPVTMTINSTNKTPTAAVSVGSPDANNGVVAGTVTASDPDADALTFTAPGSTSKGSINIAANGNFTYTPTDGAQRQAAFGTDADRQDSFTVTVSDGHGGAVAVPVHVTVRGSATNQLAGGQWLEVNQYLQSPQGRYRLYMQGDGNLVLYDEAQSHKALWASNTDGQPGLHAAMQTDGNLVLYAGTPSASTARWGSRTDGHPGAALTLQDDGNLVIYQGAQAVWATNSTNNSGGGSGGGGSSRGLSWPLSSVSVIRGFGGNGHDGIDLAAGPGTPVYAAADGVIYFEGYGTSDRAGKRSDWMGTEAGICILIWHPSLNIYTGYAHLSSTVINNGQTVTKGQLIGKSGYTGYVIPAGTGGAHLHFEVLPNNPNFSNGYAGRIDPRPYLP